MDTKWQQTLRMQVVKYGHWQVHKSKTPLSNERIKLWPLPQTNSAKLDKATVGQSYYYVLVDGHDVDDNMEKVYKW